MIFDPSVRVFPYEPAAFLRVTGEDAFVFLQGQFTQELRSQEKNCSAYGLWLNQKGKVVADSFALRDETSWWLTSPASTAATIKARLEAYVIADDVVIEDLTADWSGYSIFGSSAGPWLESAGLILPRPGAYSKVGKGLLFRGRRMEGESWEWLQPRAWQVWPDIVRQNNLVTPDEMERLRIEAKLPRVPVDLGPGDLPNEGGLEMSALSYSKGCYLGQEVMARLKSMGQVRRQLRIVRGRGGPSELPAPLFHRGKKIGELRSFAGTETGFVGLAMISILSLSDGSTCSFSESGDEFIEIAGATRGPEGQSGSAGVSPANS